MTTETPQTFASVRFKWQKDGDGKVYDYLVPSSIGLSPGDKAIVLTKRGETTVEIVEIKDTSDKATASILRIAPVEDDKPVVETMDF